MGSKAPEERASSSLFAASPSPSIVSSLSPPPTSKVALGGASPALSFIKGLQVERGPGGGETDGREKEREEKERETRPFPIRRPKIPALSTVIEGKEAPNLPRSPRFTRTAIAAAAAASFHRRAQESQGRLSLGADVSGGRERRELGDLLSSLSFASDSRLDSRSPGAEERRRGPGERQNMRYSLGSVAELRGLKPRNELSSLFGNEENHWEREIHTTPRRASLSSSSSSSTKKQRERNDPSLSPLMTVEVGPDDQESLRIAHSPVFTRRFTLWEREKASPAFSARSEPVEERGSGSLLQSSSPPAPLYPGKARRVRSISSDWELLLSAGEREARGAREKREKKDRGSSLDDVECLPSSPFSRRSPSDRYSFDATVLDALKLAKDTPERTIRQVGGERLRTTHLSDVVRDAALASHMRRRGPTRKNERLHKAARDIIRLSSHSSFLRETPLSSLAMDRTGLEEGVADRRPNSLQLSDSERLRKQEKVKLPSPRVLSPVAPPQTPIADILGVEPPTRRAFSLEREEGFPSSVSRSLPFNNRKEEEVKKVEENGRDRQARASQTRMKPPLKLQLSVNGIVSMARPSISYSQGSSLSSSPEAATESPQLFSPQMTPKIEGLRRNSGAFYEQGGRGSDSGRLSPQGQLYEGHPPAHQEDGNFYMPLSPEELDILKEQSFEAAERAGPMHLGESIILLKELGRGASGVVYMALYVPTLKLVAVKRLQVYKEEHQAMVMQELRGLHENLVPIEVKTGPFGLQFLSQENIGREHICPYIVGFYGAYAKPQESCVDLVIEYMDGGCLQDILDRGGIKNEIILAHIAHSALSALAYLHKQRMVHRDIKPANLLVNYRGDVKISDFGLATTLAGTTAHAREFQGTMIYMAPERILGGEYSYPSDVWSIGLVLFSLALGKFPFDLSEGFFGVEEAICHDPLPPLPRAFSPDFRDFVLRCLLERDPKQRISAAEALKHPFIVQNLKVEEIGRKMLRHDWITIMGNHEADVKRVQLIARTAVEHVLQKILKKKEEMSQRRGFRNSMKIALTRPFHIKRWPSRVVQALARDYGLKDGVVVKIIDHYRRKANKRLEPEVASVDQNRTRPKAYAMAMASRR